ncbi:MAG: deaminase [Alphaproteobacteria bacterium]
MFSDKWNIRFMELALVFATWSKDTSTKTGAVVIGPDKEIRATGYNGFVRGVDDDKAERYERPTKYDFFEHAERNAVYNACLTGTTLKGCTMYASHPPCTDCARAIIQSGIKRVYTRESAFPKNLETSAHWNEKASYSEEMFKEAGVEYIKLPM